MLVRACNVYFISRFGFSVMHALSLDMMRLNLARDYRVLSQAEHSPTSPRTVRRLAPRGS